MFLIALEPIKVCTFLSWVLVLGIPSISIHAHELITEYDVKKLIRY